MSAKIFLFLNNAFPEKMVSPLMQKLATLQRRAPSSQWESIINSLTRQGVKKAEIEDSKIIDHINKLKEEGHSHIERDELLEWLKQTTVAVKEVPLTRAKFAKWRLLKESKYTERVYSFATYSDVIRAQIDDIDFEIQDLDFNHEVLIENPNRAVELYEKRNELLAKLKQANLYASGHYRNIRDPETGRDLVNILAHSRISEQDGTFLIEEIQSDWAQQGRRHNWQQHEKMPFVTNTELWAGLILRRSMQIAAENSNTKQVSWIKAEYRNGGNFVSNDGLNDFYLKILPKIANRALSGTGEKVKFVKVQTPNHGELELPGFEMTDKVREKLKQPQPLYSHDFIPDQTPPWNFVRSQELKSKLKSAEEMLGDAVSIRLAAKVFDAANNQVAGKVLGNIIEISLAARDPFMTIDHEAWHYAHKNLLSPIDAQTVNKAFAHGTRLNRTVREALQAEGATKEAIEQCKNADEASAHGYALWCKGKLDLTPQHTYTKSNSFVARAVTSVFRRVQNAYTNLKKWTHRIIDEDYNANDERTVERLFEKLNDGGYSSQTSEHTKHDDEFWVENKTAHTRVRAVF